MLVIDVTGLPSSELPAKLKLGGSTEKAIEVQSKALQFLSHQGKVFLLFWTGTKTPRGGMVLGHELGWAQDGELADINGDPFGFYERLVEFGGVAGNEHAILVRSRD